MANETLMDAIGDIARDKGISQDRLLEVIQEAITAAAKRKFKNYNEVEARLNPDTGAIEVFRYKTVTEDLEDPENEISLEEAKQMHDEAETGDEVEYEIDSQELSRVIAQTARQLVFQKIREAERETIYEKFKDRVGEVLNGIVSRTERGRTFITFNQTEAILYGREQIPHERYSPGEHIRVILLDVLNDPKEPSQLVISRSHPSLLTKLFEMEVPEVYDGIVEIEFAAREPGRRAKIAVISNEPDVDPVGACVGMRGSRVQAIISELRGEKIDIIKWSDDFPTYIANALAPAELTRIKIDEEAKEIDVEVEPDQLSLAIGRQGQNVRLASKLTGYKINISSTSEKALSLEEQIRERLLASQAELTAQEGVEGATEESAVSSLAASTDDALTTALKESTDALSGDAAPSEADSTPEAAAETVAAESESAPDAAAETVAAEPDSTPDAAAETVAAEPESAPEAVPETAAETVTEETESAPDAAAETVAAEPESAPEAAPEAPADAGPAEPDSTPETAAETAVAEPDSTPDAAADTAAAEAESTPDAVAETIAAEPDSAPEAAVDAIPAEPEAAAEAAPETPADAGPAEPDSAPKTEPAAADSETD